MNLLRCYKRKWIWGLASIVFLDVPLAISRAHGKEASLSQRDHLSGSWGGRRNNWEEKGFVFDLIYTGEYFDNLDGGIDAGGDSRGDLSLTLEVDTAAAGWWEHGTFFAHIQQQHGRGITEDHVGDFQTFSNIDADDFFQVSEIWYKHYLLDNRLWLKLGKQESNEDFAFVDFGGEFINSSPGYSPTIPLVTFPDQDWGIVMGIQPAQWFSLNIGIYQGRPNGGRSLGNTLDTLRGPMFMIEPVVHYALRGNPGHLRFGYWHNGDTFDRLNGTGSEDGTDGFYWTWDQTLYREHPGDLDDEQGIGLFAQYGSSDEDLIEAKEYLGIGIQWTGPVPGRDDDIFGIGVFRVELSKEGGFTENSETVYELFYKFQVAPWISINPDLQYIANPGGTANADATVFGTRVEISF